MASAPIDPKSIFLIKDKTKYDNVLFKMVNEQEKNKVESALQTYLDAQESRLGVSGFIYYLLLDPRKVDEHSSNGNELSFEHFLDCIIYVGQGQGNRPTDHWLDITESKISNKINVLLSLLACDRGYIPIISKLVMTERESLIREFSMIKILDSRNLCNIRNGQHFDWTNMEEYERQLGYLSILDAYHSFKQKKPREFRFKDLAFGKRQVRKDENIVNQSTDDDQLKEEILAALRSENDEQVKAIIKKLEETN